MQEPGNPVPDCFGKTLVLQVEIRNGLTTPAEAEMAVWSGTAVSYSLALYTQARLAFGNSTHVLS